MYKNLTKILHVQKIDLYLLLVNSTYVHMYQHMHTQSAHEQVEFTIRKTGMS